MSMFVYSKYGCNVNNQKFHIQSGYNYP
uniref:Uncharacterized protein n=1 Tax=Rhizophora mucronata TaxID=61149 RepID=A0A2P2KEM9_RHIMU